SGERIDPYRTTIEFVDHCVKQPSVGVVEPEMVYFKQVQSLGSDFLSHRSVPHHLGNVANTTKHSVGDSRRTASTRRERLRSLIFQLNAQNFGGPMDDIFHRFLIVEFKAQHGAEPVSQRAG